MAWVILIVSGLFETAWAAALDRMDGRFHLGWFVVFVLTATISMGGLMLAMKDIPVGTAYAVWAGTGVAATVAWSILSGAESANPVRLALVTVLIGCVAGLHLIEGR